MKESPIGITWNEESRIDYEKVPITEGDIRGVTLPVKVAFEWSDHIIDDHDEETGQVYYKSGWVMKILTQEVVYDNEPTVFFAQAQKEVSTVEQSTENTVTNTELDSMARASELIKEFGSGENARKVVDFLLEVVPEPIEKHKSHRDKFFFKYWKSVKWFLRDN